MSNLYFEEGERAIGQKVMLATPSYASPCPAYVFAIARSREALSAAGIQSAYLLLQGHCHVDDSRNAIVRLFLESDCTELVFLDADVDWEPAALVQLCQRDCDVVGGVYPYRREGSEEMPVRMIAQREAVDGLLEVEGLPTGFLKLKRRVLQTMADAAPKFWDKIYETALVFDRPTPGADKTRWGGDVDFCNRWRARGGQIFADQEIRLGHTGTMVVRDSLGSHVRRVTGVTLKHVTARIRAGTENEGDYNEAFKYAGNPYAADPGILALVTGIARRCRGAILETGSGLSSVLMGAAAPDQQIYSLEHLEHFASRTLAWCEEGGIANVGVCCAPLKDFWYDIERFTLPNKFAFGFCDGPPRLYGTRRRFLDVFAARCTVLLIDDVKQDVAYLRHVFEWAAANGRQAQLLGRAALITKNPSQVLEQAA